MSVTQLPFFPRMTEAEWQTRVDLAACYRLIDLVRVVRSDQHPHHRARAGAEPSIF